MNNTVSDEPLLAEFVKANVNFDVLMKAKKIFYYLQNRNNVKSLLLKVPMLKDDRTLIERILSLTSTAKKNAILTMDLISDQG